ncbi:MAG TPA: hypothetical protein VK176_02800, partial [Phycisphaerales bacterium]|nr:hypothetical protein [Phycisphaerales bacterium]
MPEQQASSNRALRILVPLAMLVVGLVVTWSVSRNSAPKSGQVQPAAATPSAPTGGTSVASQPAGQGAGDEKSPVADQKSAGDQSPSMSAAPPAPAPANATSGYRAAVFAGDPLAANFASLGSLDPKVAKGLLEFSSIGAGIKDFRFSEHHTDWRRTEHYKVQNETVVSNAVSADGSIAPATLTPMAALAIEVNGQFVVLASSDRGPTWRQVAADRPGVFEAFVEDGQGARILRIERRYVVGKAYDIQVHQDIENLTSAEVKVRWLQLGPVDLPHVADGYGGDRRRMPFGYVAPPEVDPARSVVMARDYVSQLRTALVGPLTTMGYAAESSVWPDLNATQKRLEVSWVAMVNRYFGAAVHVLTPADGAAGSRVLSWVQDIKRIAVNHRNPDGTFGDPYLAYRLDSKPVAIAPGGRSDMSLGMWVGPLSRPAIKDEPSAEAAGLGGMIVNNMGGPCGFCTFDTITMLLRGVLHFLHD